MKKTNMLLSASLLIFIGCGESSIDNQLSTLISNQNLKGDPSIGKTIPLLSDLKVQLGMKLFFTKSLGGDNDSACVTCHHPSLGGGDNLSLSIGVGAIDPDLLGTGRVHNSSSTNYDGFAPVPRNAPSTYNLALWDKSLFWDGRVESLTPIAGKNGSVGGISTPDSGFAVADSRAGANLAVAQARFPVTSPEEMRGFIFESTSETEVVRTHLALRLSDSSTSDYIMNTWQNEFTSIYGANSVNFENIVDAIGEYERSQLFVDTPWKNYVEGNSLAISDASKRGAVLFYTSYENGGANCVSCHSGDFFTDEEFHVMAVPQVGHGKGNGITNDDDFGRENVDSNSSYKYAFRTPTLLNIEMTGPWGHAGAYTSLRAMVKHMLNPDDSVENYDVLQLNSDVKIMNMMSNTKNALTQLKSNRQTGLSIHQNVSFTDTQIDDLVTFLESLTDPCLKDKTCIGKWIPDNILGIDSLQLNAVDNNGDLL